MACGQRNEARNWSSSRHDKINRLKRHWTFEPTAFKFCRKERLRKFLPIISLVGYTNADTIWVAQYFNAAKFIRKKEMFATLDPTSKAFASADWARSYCHRYGWFIRDLPEALVAAFRATLEEIGDSRFADSRGWRIESASRTTNWFGRKILNDLAI